MTQYHNITRTILHCSPHTLSQPHCITQHLSQSMHQCLITLYNTSSVITGSGTQALVANMNAFLLALSALSSDTSARVRKAVCQAIILLATVQLSVLEPMFGSICTFMLKGVLDDDEGAILSCFLLIHSISSPFLSTTATPNPCTAACGNLVYYRHSRT